ncbi:hypothetical protein KJ644_02895 [Candidatus Dependentiae bacterium]|nr:hypothetical protein [Candidatus Dependentiae bacterium]MCG2756785.1 hypothetical protein [Candidatus Dependentiae bacterium]
MENINFINQATKFNGNIYLFYAIDIGEEVDLDKIRKKRLVNTKDFASSPYFKNYHIPLFFDIESLESKSRSGEDFIKYDSYCISSKLHQFGVVSFCYKVPFNETIDDLRTKLVEIKKDFDFKAEQEAAKTFERVSSAIKKPRFLNLDSFYFAVQVDPIKGAVSPEEFKNMFGTKIASLLRLETLRLSEYQEKEILAATTGYSGLDLIIIDSEGAFIYDDEYFDSLEFFEFTNIQQLELQYFDRLLDEKLNYFYSQQNYTIPWTAYIPFLGQRFNLPVSVLAQLRVDISVITERLENSIKMEGEAYYLRVYSMLREKMGLSGWRTSISRKLDIIQDLYSVYQDRLDVIHEEVLTMIVIFLIMVETLVAFLK